MKDYYSILGVPRTATEDEIKRAFRKLAMQHHPDRGGDEHRFKEINEAYDTLGDAQKRQAYDNPPRAQTHFNMGGAPFNFDDIFSMFGAQFRQPQHQPLARLALWITLRDAAVGGPRPVALQVNNSVTTVQIDIPPGIGDGDTIRYPGLAPGGADLIITYRIHPDKIWDRDGRNLTTTVDFSIWDLILGKEITIDDITGTTLSLTIPPNTQPGSLLRLRGRGMPSNNLPGHGGPPGDLFVRVQARLPAVISEDLLAAIRREHGH